MGSNYESEKLENTLHSDEPHSLASTWNGFFVYSKKGDDSRDAEFPSPEKSELGEWKGQDEGRR